MSHETDQYFRPLTSLERRELGISKDDAWRWSYNPVTGELQQAVMGKAAYDMLKPQPYEDHDHEDDPGFGPYFEQG